jgi:hypothetical protein
MSVTPTIITEEIFSRALMDCMVSATERLDALMSLVAQVRDHVTHKMGETFCPDETIPEPELVLMGITSSLLGIEVGYGAGRLPENLYDLVGMLIGMPGEPTLIFEEAVLEGAINKESFVLQQVPADAKHFGDNFLIGLSIGVALKQNTESNQRVPAWRLLFPDAAPGIAW